MTSLKSIKLARKLFHFPIRCYGKPKWTFWPALYLPLLTQGNAALHRFSRVRLCDPIDGSPPGSAVPGILQARTLEWVAISFSSAWKWKVKVKSLNGVRLSVTPWTAAYQTPPSLGFSRWEYWSGLPLPSPREMLVFIKLISPSSSLCMCVHSGGLWASVTFLHYFLRNISALQKQNFTL